MKKITYLAVFCLFTVIFTSLVRAESSEVTENLKRRLQESLSATPSGSEQAETLRGYVGLVKDVIGNTLIVEHKDGKQDVKLSDDTTIVRAPGNNPIKATNINIGDSIIAIGSPGNDSILLGRRLVVSASALSTPTKTTALGTIKKIAKSSLTLSLKDQDQLVETTTKTIFKSPAGVIDAADLAVGDIVIYTATLDDNDQTATIVMRIKTGNLEASN